MKGLTLIEEGYCNDALNLVSQLNQQDVKFIYLKYTIIVNTYHLQSVSIYKSG